MKPNEVLYVVIGVIVGYVMVSEVYRCVRELLRRRRAPPPALETAALRRRRHNRSAAPPPRHSFPDLRSFKADKTMADAICCICLEPFRDLDVTAGSCNHTLHTACVVKWLEKDKAQSCPVCRKPFVADIAAPPPTPAQSFPPTPSPETNTPADSVPSSPPPETAPPPTPAQSVPSSPPSAPVLPTASVSSSLTEQSIVLPPPRAPAQFVPQPQEQSAAHLGAAAVSG